MAEHTAIPFLCGEARTSAEACLTGWPNARPQGRETVQCCASLPGWPDSVCVKCNAAVPLYSCNGLPQPTCLQPCQSLLEREAWEGKDRARELERPCATVFRLLGFITTVSLTSSTHCMLGGPALCMPRVIGLMA